MTHLREVSLRLVDRRRRSAERVLALRARADAHLEQLQHGRLLVVAPPERGELHSVQHVLQIFRCTFALLCEVGATVAGVLLFHPDQLAVVQLGPAQFGVAEGAAHEPIRQDNQHGAAFADPLLHPIRGEVLGFHVVPNLQSSVSEQQCKLTSLVLPGFLGVGDEDIVVPVFVFQQLEVSIADRFRLRSRESPRRAVAGFPG